MSNLLKRPFKPPGFITPLKAPTKAQTRSEGNDESGSKLITPSHPPIHSASGKSRRISPLVSKGSKQDSSLSSLNLNTQQVSSTPGGKNSQPKDSFSNASLSVTNKSHSAPSTVSNLDASPIKRVKKENKKLHKSNNETSPLLESNRQRSTMEKLSQTDVAHSTGSSGFDGSLPNINFDSQNSSLASSRSSSRSVTPIRELANSVPWGIYVTPLKDTVLDEFRKKLKAVSRSADISVTTDDSDKTEAESSVEIHVCPNEANPNPAIAIQQNTGDIASYEHTLQHVRSRQAISHNELSKPRNSQEALIDDAKDTSGCVEFVDLTAESNPSLVHPNTQNPLSQLNQINFSNARFMVGSGVKDFPLQTLIDEESNNEKLLPVSNDSSVKLPALELNQSASVTRDSPSISHEGQVFSSDLFDSENSRSHDDTNSTNMLMGDETGKKNRKKPNHSVPISQKIGSRTVVHIGRNNDKITPSTDQPANEVVTSAMKKPSVIRMDKPQTAVSVRGKIISKPKSERTNSRSLKTLIDNGGSSNGSQLNQEATAKIKSFKLPVAGAPDKRGRPKKSESGKTNYSTCSLKLANQENIQVLQESTIKKSAQNPVISKTGSRGRPKKVGFEISENQQFQQESRTRKFVKNPIISKEKSATEQKMTNADERWEGITRNNFRRSVPDCSPSKNIPNNSEQDRDDLTPEIVELAVKEALDTGALPKIVNNRKLNQFERLRALHKLRDVGLWVQCCNRQCSKWRYLNEFKDPVEVPRLWYCKMNRDPIYNACSKPEQVKTPEEEFDLIENKFTAGSIVWARVTGFPFWPGMVEDDPEIEQFYWLRDYAHTEVTDYHVTFFDSKNVTRAWIPAQAVMPFFDSQSDSFIKKVVGRHKIYLPRILAAQNMALEALKLDNVQRLKKFSFINRYTGPIFKKKGLSQDSQETNADFVSDSEPQHSAHEGVSQKSSEELFSQEKRSSVSAADKKKNTVQNQDIADSTTNILGSGLFSEPISITETNVSHSKNDYQFGPSQFESTQPMPFNILSSPQLGPSQLDSTQPMLSDVSSCVFQESESKEPKVESLDDCNDLNDPEVSSSQGDVLLNDLYDASFIIKSPVMDSMEDLTPVEVMSLSQESQPRNVEKLLYPVSSGLKRLSLSGS